MATLTAIVEFLVGVACLALAVPMWRRPGGVRGAAALLAVAGAVAVVNAAVSLAQ
jgi:hypothetical protein